MRLAEHLDESSRLHAYFDLHAHVQNHGAFAYGNDHEYLDRKVQIRTIPRLLHLLCPFFKYQLSSFAFKDKSQLYVEDARNIHFSKLLKCVLHREGNQ